MLVALETNVKRRAEVAERSRQHNRAALRPLLNHLQVMLGRERPDFLQIAGSRSVRCGKLFSAQVTPLAERAGAHRLNGRERSGRRPAAQKHRDLNTLVRFGRADGPGFRWRGAVAPQKTDTFFLRCHNFPP